MSAYGFVYAWIILLTKLPLIIAGLVVTFLDFFLNAKMLQ